MMGTASGTRDSEEWIQACLHELFPHWRELEVGVNTSHDLYDLSIGLLNLLGLSVGLRPCAAYIGST